MPEISVFDERLAEIDRRLRAIQSDLTPVPDPPARLRAAPSPPATDPAPPEPAPPAPAQPGDAATLVAELHELRAANERMLELHRDLLAQYAELLERLADDRLGADAGLRRSSR